MSEDVGLVGIGKCVEKLLSYGLCVGVDTNDIEKL